MNLHNSVAPYVGVVERVMVREPGKGARARYRSFVINTRTLMVRSRLPGSHSYELHARQEADAVAASLCLRDCSCDLEAVS
jgi:hypothetical protein